MTITKGTSWQSFVREATTMLEDDPNSDESRVALDEITRMGVMVNEPVESSECIVPGCFHRAKQAHYLCPRHWMIGSVPRDDYAASPRGDAERELGECSGTHELREWLRSHVLPLMGDKS